jgi:hypothetical protein
MTERETAELIAAILINLPVLIAAIAAYFKARAAQISADTAAHQAHVNTRLLNGKRKEDLAP